MRHLSGLLLHQVVLILRLVTDDLRIAVHTPAKDEGSRPGTSQYRGAAMISAPATPEEVPSSVPSEPLVPGTPGLTASVMEAMSNFEAAPVETIATETMPTVSPIPLAKPAVNKVSKWLKSSLVDHDHLQMGVAPTPARAPLQNSDTPAPFALYRGRRTDRFPYVASLAPFSAQGTIPSSS